MFQTLKIIQEQGTVLSEGFKSLQSEADNQNEAGEAVQDEEQKKNHLEKEEEFRGMFIQIRQRVKKLLQEAADYVAKIHFHRVAISELATSIDKRYKDLEQVMKQYRESLENKLQTTLPTFEVSFIYLLRKSSVEECILLCIAFYFECQFNKNSFLQIYFFVSWDTMLRSVITNSFLLHEVRDACL